jgi:hypothetical protein
MTTFGDGNSTSLSLLAKTREKFEGDGFQAIDDRIGFVEQFCRMRVGDGEAFHAGAAGAFDAFFRVFDDDAFTRLDRLAVLPV